MAVGTGQYAFARNIDAKRWDIFEPLMRGATLNQHPDPAQLNAVAAAHDAFRIWTVGAKGAIFVIDDICRACSKK
jgi:hypothetical protein